MERFDLEEVIRIYGQGLATGEATFEIEVPTSENWDKAHLPPCVFWTKKSVSWQVSGRIQLCSREVSPVLI